MKKKLLLVGAAAAALTLATPAMASAAPPYNVAVGGSTAAGNHAFTAAAVGSITFAVPLNTMTCTSAGASGFIHSGTGKSGVDPNPLATINSTTWSGCTEQFGTPLTVTHGGQWHLATNDTSVTSAATDQVDGWIDHISAHVTDSTGLCDFTVTGSADGHFDEATQRLVVDETGDGSLTVTTVVSDCLGSVSVGDPASFNGTYNVSVPDGAVNVS